MKKLLLTSFAALMGAWAVQAARVSSVAVRMADGDKNTGDVLARCQVKVGDEYDPQVCARDVRVLRDTGEFDEINVKVDEGTDGIDVVYQVSRKVRFLAPLVVQGNDYWNEGKISNLSQLQDGYAYGKADFEAAAGRVRAEYQKKFFPDVKVTPVVTPVPENPGAVTVTLKIEEGTRQKVRDFVFEGNESFEDDVLRETFNQYPWWNPLGWFSDVPSTDQDLSEACDKVKAFYRNHGYLDVEVEMPTRVEVGDGKIDRCFKVLEGTKYAVGKMSVVGVTKYPADLALGSVRNIKTGDVAGAAALDAAAHAIEVFCGSGEKALAETRVTVQRIPSEEDDRVLDLVFKVEEGVPVVVNRVVIRGNDYTKDKVLRREVALSPGDPMLSDKAERSKKRLENLRYFERVRYYLEKVDGVAAAAGEPEKRDLVFEVAEKNTGNFIVGVGAGSEDSVFGQVELSESNFDLFSPWRFRGAGQKGRICVMAGPRVQTYEASVTEPWFLDRQLELMVEVYRRQRWYDDYDVIRNGAAATLSYPVKFWPTWKAFGRIGTSIAAEYIQYDDVEGDSYYLDRKLGSHQAGDYGPVLKWEDDEYGDKWEIPLELFWRMDTRDQFLFPKNGHVIKIYGDVVEAENEYWRVGFRLRKYWTVWDRYGLVFQFGLRGETLDTFSGSDNLPLYDRLFLGGSRSIRGVDFREIAPRLYAQKNKHGHYIPWGGQTSWCGTTELSIPVWKILRVAVFSDFGSVGADEFDFDADWFCWSAGAGIRLDLEQFPIRLDFATPVVDPDEDVDEKVFSFSVGYDF